MNHQDLINACRQDWDADTRYQSKCFIQSFARTPRQGAI